MYIWLALLIPVVITILIAYFFPHKWVWWELLIPFPATLIFVLGFKATVEHVRTSDTQYESGLIVQVQYYEYWETWVHRTCSRSYKCGKSTCTTYYDCSYCDENSAKWVAVSNLGNKYSISQTKYNKLKQLWANETFKDLHRSINNHFACGEDGDMYYSDWDRKPETSESNVEEVSYTNYIQASHSAFKLEEVKEEDAKKLGLYKYPEIFDDYRQQCVLGLENITYYKQNPNIKTEVEKQFEYLNGLYGPKYKTKIFLLLFPNKTVDVAYKQEAYWDGGNQNEVVICIGLDPNTKELDWVYPFSWNKNKRLQVDLREDISELKYFYPNEIYKIVSNEIPPFYKVRNFKEEFKYLTLDPPLYQVILTFVISILLSTGIGYWVIHNQH